MENLPIEVLEKILTNKTLRLSDISSTLQTCSRLQAIIQESNFIWKHVFFQRWPEFLSVINVEEITDWFREVKHVFNLQLEIKNLLVKMASRFIKVDTLFSRDFSDFDEIVNNRKYNYLYVTNYLSYLMEKKYICSIIPVPCDTDGNLTLRYYSYHVFYHLHISKCVNEFKEFLKIPESLCTLEKCATFISKSLQPFKVIEYDTIKGVLDSLSNQAYDELRLINPRHPLFNITEDIRLSWKDKILDGNIFQEEHILQILNAINVVLYDKNKFDGLHNDSNNYYSINNSFIDMVLETGYGLPILLSIIYESVSRRLGVNCLPLNIPQHFILKTIYSEPPYKAIYIDPFNKGTMFRKPCSMATGNHSNSQRATSNEVLIRMLNNLGIFYQEKTLLNFEYKLLYRFKLMLHPNNENTIRGYANAFYFRNLPLEVCSKFMEELNNLFFIHCRSNPFPKNSEECVLNALESKLFKYHRSNDLGEKYFLDQPYSSDEPIFPMGSIVIIKSLNSRGVIVGSTPDYIKQHCWNYLDDNLVSVHSKETFYFLIDELGFKKCISKDDLKLDTNPSRLPDIIDIGKYFSHFFVNHYVPNEEMNRLYPYDEKNRQKHYQDLLFMKKITFPVE